MAWTPLGVWPLDTARKQAVGNRQGKMNGHGMGMEFEIVTTKLFIENGPILPNLLFTPNLTNSQLNPWLQTFTGGVYLSFVGFLQ